MIKHIVFLTFKKDLSTEQITDIMNGFRKFPAMIDGLYSYTWGYNNSPEGLGRDYTCAFIMDIADSATRKQYLEHPAHVTFSQQIVLPALEKGIDSVTVFDYDI